MPIQNIFQKKFNFLAGTFFSREKFRNFNLA